MTTTKTQPSAQDLQGELDGPAPGIPDVLNDGTRTHDRQWSVGITRHGVAFWVVAVAFLFNMAFSAVPTPLYVLYQQRDHFSQIMVTIVYAVYAVGVIASLFLAGHISDWVGRRKVLALALLVNVISAVLFILFPSLPGRVQAHAHVIFLIAGTRNRVHTRRVRQRRRRSQSRCAR